MNLNMLVSPIVAAINPWTPAAYEASVGASTAASGRRTPGYATAVPMNVQSQAMTYKDLMQIQGLNMNGEKRAFYVDGDWHGISRTQGLGGDLITLCDRSVWLVAQILENWASTDGWTKVAVVRQMPPPTP